MTGKVEQEARRDVEKFSLRADGEKWNKDVFVAVRRPTLRREMKMFVKVRRPTLRRVMKIFLEVRGPRYRKGIQGLQSQMTYFIASLHFNGACH